VKTSKNVAYTHICGYIIMWTRSSIVAVVKKGEATGKKCGAYVHAINT
jgi:hypothetical protein